MAEHRRRRTVSSCSAAGAVALGAWFVAAEGAQVAARTEPASAFLAAPGIVRTEIRGHHIDADENSGIAYIVTDESIGGYDLSDPFAPVQVVEMTQGPEFLRGADVVDMDVSSDGASIQVARRDRVIPVLSIPDGFDNDVLLADEAVFVEGASDRRRVAAAPGDPRVFATWTDGADVWVYDDRRGTEVNASADLIVGPVMFGATSDTIIGLGPSRDGSGQVLREVSWNETPTVVREGAAVAGASPTTIARRGDRIWLDDRVFDATTFDLIRSVDLGAIGGGEVESFDSSGRPEVVFRRGGEWMLVDPSDAADPVRSRWTFPFERPVDDVVSLGDGLVAVVEQETNGPERFLVIASAMALGSHTGEYFPIRPRRVLDTREGVGAPERPLGPAASIELDVASGLPVDPADVIAVVVNVAVELPTADTYVTVWPTGIDQPLVSNVNVSPGRTLANMVTVPVGSGGRVSIYNNRGNSDVVADLVGYYVGTGGPDGSRYEPLAGRRIADTRLGQPIGRLQRDATMSLQLPELGLAGREVTAAVVNVTGVQPSVGGFLTTWARGEPRPLASTLNVAPGTDRANLAVVPVSADGGFSIYNGAGDIDVVVDLVGVYATTVAGDLSQRGRYLPAVPFRVFDSREDPLFPPPGALFPMDGVIFRNFTDYTEVVNATVADADRSGFMSVVGWSDSSTVGFPSTSTVNFVRGETAANAAYATGAPNHAVVNPVAIAHLIVDVFGYLTPTTLRPPEDVWGS